MQLTFSKYIIAAGVLVAFGYGCEKKVDPIDTYGVTVEYNSSNPKCITENTEINPKDSIYLDFTVTSEKEMAFVEIQKNGVRIDTFVVSGGKTSFSAIKGYRADSIAGDYSYRVLARTKQTEFLGDGGKLLTVTVKPDFNFWSYRIMAVPDTTDKVNKCYYSTTTGEAFNFNEAGGKSASIDFGYYFDTTSISGVKNGHTFYALSAPQTQLNFYDISSWTKNATVFKMMPSSVNFVSGLTSAGAINTLIKNNMNSGTGSKVIKVNTTSGSNVIGFKTVAGKYGAILFRYANQASDAKTTTIEVDVKVQK
ncbi:hypothetical protein FAM09_14685 [Niastella caeni]|uniref:Uncharacterized protein n=1 Tax=Niastella caeni TaxID=2569763 RepID=A0A4S8HVS2_9BACT|nr:hypothetical protein [Niastella caeni]THU39737.1 hypothetical protein FAM09_14685 [Niastella caeni]